MVFFFVFLVAPLCDPVHLFQSCNQHCCMKRFAVALKKKCRASRQPTHVVFCCFLLTTSTHTHLLFSSIPPIRIYNDCACTRCLKTSIKLFVSTLCFVFYFLRCPESQCPLIQLKTICYTWTDIEKALRELQPSEQPGMVYRSHRVFPVSHVVFLH